MNENFISLWAGNLETALALPGHLTPLYRSIGTPQFVKDPEVCAERELAPIHELLEPFSLPAGDLNKALSNAERRGLSLAAVVVAVYTYEAQTGSDLSGCGLFFIGSFQCQTA